MLDVLLRHNIVSVSGGKRQSIAYTFRDEPGRVFQVQTFCVILFPSRFPLMESFIPFPNIPITSEFPGRVLDYLENADMKDFILLIQMYLGRHSFLTLEEC